MTMRNPARQAGPRAMSKAPLQFVQVQAPRADGESPREASAAERRHSLVAEAAYFRAARRGFAPGHEVDDWLEAEREIEDRLFSGELPPF